MWCEPRRRRRTRGTRGARQLPSFGDEVLCDAVPFSSVDAAHLYPAQPFDVLVNALDNDKKGVFSVFSELSEKDVAAVLRRANDRQRPPPLSKGTSKTPELKFPVCVSDEECSAWQAAASLVVAGESSGGADGSLSETQNNTGADDDDDNDDNSCCSASLLVPVGLAPRDHLPREVWSLVFDYLSPASIAAMMRVCFLFSVLGREHLPPLSLGTLRQWTAHGRPMSKTVLERSVRDLIYSAQSRDLPFAETVSLSVQLRRWDPRQHRRLRVAAHLPHPIFHRRRKYCLLGGDLLQAALELGLDCWDEAQLAALRKDKRLVKRFGQSYDAFFASPYVIRRIPRLVGPGLNKIQKFPFLLDGERDSSGSLPTGAVAARVCDHDHFCRWFMGRATTAVSVPIGHAKMSPQQLAENLLALVDTTVKAISGARPGDPWSYIKSVRVSATRGRSYILMTRSPSASGGGPAPKFLGGAFPEHAGASKYHVAFSKPSSSQQQAKSESGFYKRQRNSRQAEALRLRSKCVSGRKGAGTRHKNEKLGRNQA